MKTDIVIVGGGITGILCALRLSNNKNISKEIVLIDSHQTLGGRFFLGNSPKSGSGFEHKTPLTLETLKRHLYLYLTEDEKNYLENWVNEKTQKKPFSKIIPKKYFVKKDFLNSEYILLSNSEFLTKKDAEILQSIVQIQKNPLYEKEKDKIFEQSSFWKNLHKNSQENILPILESFLGKYALTFPVKILSEKLTAFYETQTYHDPFFLRITEIEIALEHLLQERGIIIYTNCILKSVEKQNSDYELCLINKDISKLNCEKIIFTIQPYYIRTIISVDDLSVQLSRFLSKVQPTSMLYLEVTDVQDKWAEHFENKFKTYDRLYFPVEGIEAFITSDNRLICSIELDYETSLQAPSVRESINFLRRALKRILKPEFAEELKKGSFIRKTEAFEKIILQTVAFNVPNRTQIEHLPEFNDISLRAKNIYISGDYLYSLGDKKWKQITKSVEFIVQEIEKKSE